MAQYSIKKVETLSGVKAHTLRIWEQRYDFLKPKRTDTNIRYYTDEQLKLLLNISILNRNGIKISKIAGMSMKQVGDEVMKITDNTLEPDSLLDALVQSMIDFDEKKFENTLTSAVIRLGFEESFSKLIFPFMIRIGSLWSVGAIRPVQEHFISNLIRRKLAAAIDSQVIEPDKDSKKLVLFLHEEETHELLLMYTQYLLRLNNHEVAYIGSSVPFEDIEFIKKVFKPDYLVTFITVGMSNMTLEEYLIKLSKAFPHTPIIAGGAQFNLQHATLPVNVSVVSSHQDLMDAISI